jgi:hypothetical protein
MTLQSNIESLFSSVKIKLKKLDTLSLIFFYFVINNLEKLKTHLFNVHRLVRSNMNKIATESLQAAGTWSQYFLSPTTRK